MTGTPLAERQNPDARRLVMTILRTRVGNNRKDIENARSRHAGRSLYSFWNGTIPWNYEHAGEFRDRV
jgi:hypothetical protein